MGSMTTVRWDVNPPPKFKNISKNILLMVVSDGVNVTGTTWLKRWSVRSAFTPFLSHMDNRYSWPGRLSLWSPLPLAGSKAVKWETARGP